MLDNVKISNFKVIENVGLTLKKLSNINYLVGKNGCGKSSVLEILTLLKLYKVNNIIRTQRERYLDIFINIGNTSWDYDDRVIGEDSGYLSVKGLSLYSKSTQNRIIFDLNLIRNITLQNEYGNFIDISKFSLFDESHSSLVNIIEGDENWNVNNNLHEIKVFYFTNRIISRLNFVTTQNIHPWLYKEYKKIIKEFIPNFETAVSDSHIVVDIQELNYTQLSSGEINILELINNIFLSDFVSSPCLFLIDEPEGNLHPKFQKLIPLILNRISLLCEEKDFVQFIISTHSPFIISAAAEFYDSQKVYLIENGQTVDLGGILGQGQDGYSGGECLLAVNKMLGSDLNDIAPHSIIFCERTLKLFLESLFEFNKPLRPIILTDKAGGSDEHIKIMTEIFDSVRKADKVNLLDYKIYGVIDKCGKEEPWKKQLGDKLMVLNEAELERLYDIQIVNSFLKSKGLPFWDKLVNKEFAKDYCKITKVSNTIEKSNLKVELAIYMGTKTSKEQFKIFCPELHDLIFT